MVYKETQSLKRTWLIPLVLLIQLVVGVLGLTGGYATGQAEQGWISFGIVLLVTVPLLLLFSSMRLETRMDAFGLSFRSPPFINSWRKYKWEEVEDIQLLSTRPPGWIGGLGLHLGWSIGIRMGLNGEWRYVFSSGHAVRILLKDSKFVLSTRRPEDLMAAWEEWKVGK
ncbi:hypothetical protein [Cyclobacterium jeungdonense]|uniref:Bacterial Pleckstrin homology domain-containing protein n=1 Tax=Cyclobacterium jeungdonense TaxID=708087 RepID=A0ABT8C4A8_9BACT|nr:hypothetical protein [Cyclobacterium jeungdonense]MDN3686596.1 hypothetical protein [Cyclobacterium jeungdonense]